MYNNGTWHYCFAIDEQGFLKNILHAHTHVFRFEEKLSRSLTICCVCIICYYPVPPYPANAWQHTTTAAHNTAPDTARGQGAVTLIRDDFWRVIPASVFSCQVESNSNVVEGLRW